ncbi:MAG: T9SS type A sorting domain-containing protein [Bacteroidia bacterium]|nr:T9SS type A sorting domain-containing protein [Bacteroidia bacterium]
MKNLFTLLFFFFFCGIAFSQPCNIGTINQIATLPYTSGALTTCGAVDNITSANAVTCGSTLYFGGEDAVHTFTPTFSGQLEIAITSTGSWSGLFLYAGCPISGGSCITNSTSSTGSKTVCANVVAGTVYYVVIDSWPSPTCNPYSLSISGCSGVPAGGTANTTSASVCASGNTVGLSVTGSSTGACGFTYQWQSAPAAAGPWTNVGGATAATYSPGITGVICYRRLTTCAAGTGTSTSVCLSIATCAAPTGGSAAAAPTVACAAGGTVALSVTGGSTGCGYTYQWESAPAAAGPWTNIAGATFSTAVGTVNSPSTCFRRRIMCGASSATSTAVCVTPAATCASQLGSGVVAVGALPYSTSGTTCGSGNDLTTANVSTSGCSSTSYFTGEDQVFVFTPTTNGNITINLTSTGTWTGLMLYNTCPLSCSGSSGCVGSSTSSTGNKSLVVCVNAGTTYYLILDSFASPACNPYSSLTISAPSVTSTTNDFCSSPTSLSSGGTFTGSTTGMTADQPGNLSGTFCGSTENNQWFSFVATAATHTFGFTGIGGASCPYGVQGQVFNVATTPTPCASCTSFTNQSTPCYNPGTTASGTLTATSLTIGQTYYLVVDGNAGSACTFSINGWSTPVLPVDLISFNGIGLDTKTNKLEWRVAMESNFDHYQIQRSVDGKSFSDLDKVFASVSSNSEKTYNYYDKSFVENINYYRLKIVDKDATFRYSNLVAINSDKSSKFKVNKIFPNPANTDIYMSVDIPTDTEIEYQILDVTGRIVAQSKQAVSMGTTVLSVNLEKLSKGIYYLKFDCNNETKVEKFSLQ